MSLVGDEGLTANAPLWSRSWYTRPVMVALHAWTLIVGKTVGLSNPFALGFDPESLKSLDCLTRAVIACADVAAPPVPRAAVIVTTPFFGSESCRSETTLPFLEIRQAAGDPAGSVAFESVTLAGNVMSAEPSCDDLAVFVIATFTA